MIQNSNQEITIDTRFYKVEKLIHLTGETFIIQLSKNRFSFKAGQHISLSLKGDYQSREYSVYNGENDSNLQILAKEISGGHVSPKLKNLEPGDWLEINGPFGHFGLDEKKRDSHQHVFIASGTGISPFHSMVKTYPGLNYRLIHGVRYSNEAYGMEEYEREKYILCTSRDSGSNYHGRLTGYLKEAEFAENTVFYLCGNSDMIFDAMEILKNKGFGRDDIKVEVYF